MFTSLSPSLMHQCWLSLGNCPHPPEKFTSQQLDNSLDDFPTWLRAMIWYCEDDIVLYVMFDGRCWCMLTLYHFEDQLQVFWRVWSPLSVVYVDHNNLFPSYICVLILGTQRSPWKRKGRFVGVYTVTFFRRWSMILFLWFEEKMSRCRKFKASHELTFTRFVRSVCRRGLSRSQEGKCTRGNRCTFAHGVDQLRPRPDLFKTRPPLNWCRR